MEKLTELLFSLSSDDRRKILSNLQKKHMRLTQLSQELSTSVQETSQHLMRLNKAKLVEKHIDGFYMLTAYGGQILRLLSSFSFLSNYIDYFLSHDLSFLPPEFVQRIGDLSVHHYVTHVSEMIQQVETIACNANQYVWLLVDRPPTYRFEFGNPGKITLRAVVSNIQPEAVQYGKNILGNRLEINFLEHIKMSLNMNEEMACITFPSLDGKIDFNAGFVSASPSFHRWCYDLFTYYWDKSRKLT